MGVYRSHADANSAFRRLADECGREWPSIIAAAGNAKQEREKLAVILGSPPLFSSDASIVVFGSLARDEFTLGSDVDWTLLVDGQVDSQHLRMAQTVEKRLKNANYKEPGPSQTFGAVSFSHSLVHDIGGGNDTNANTTRRMLLLLEARAIGNDDALERVQRAVIQRYLEDDLAYVFAAHPVKLPRFLLNDVVRFWRTIAVDFASKHRERQGEKWAIRNVKLRFSRKVLFAAGLISCFDAARDLQHAEDNLFGPSPKLQPLASKLRSYAQTTPLEVIAESILKSRPCDPGLMFDAYDRFLAVLNDREERDRLTKLTETSAAEDRLFQELRSEGQKFASALQRLFFDTADYGPLTRQYGVF